MFSRGFDLHRVLGQKLIVLNSDRAERDVHHLLLSFQRPDRKQVIWTFVKVCRFECSRPRLKASSETRLSSQSFGFTGQTEP